MAGPLAGVPGFRSGVLWKTILAALGYALAGLVLIGLVARVVMTSVDQGSTVAVAPGLSPTSVAVTTTTRPSAAAAAAPTSPPTPTAVPPAPTAAPTPISPTIAPRTGGAVNATPTPEPTAVVATPEPTVAVAVSTPTVESAPAPAQGQARPAAPIVGKPGPRIATPRPPPPATTLPVERPTAAAGRGVPPATRSACPASHPIKGNQGSRSNADWVYHPPDSPSYRATAPEECFATAADAEAAGYRAPRNMP